MMLQDCRAAARINQRIEIIGEPPAGGFEHRRGVERERKNGQKFGTAADRDKPKLSGGDEFVDDRRLPDRGVEYRGRGISRRRVRDIGAKFGSLGQSRWQRATRPSRSRGGSSSLWMSDFQRGRNKRTQSAAHPPGELELSRHKFPLISF